MSYDPIAAPPSRPPKATLAMYSSICPVCHIYITRNWSEIVRLPETMPVHCRDRNGNPGYECDDATRLGSRPLLRRRAKDRCSTQHGANEGFDSPTAVGTGRPFHTSYVCAPT